MNKHTEHLGSVHCFSLPPETNSESELEKYLPSLFHGISPGGELHFYRHLVILFPKKKLKSSNGDLFGNFS